MNKLLIVCGPTATGKTGLGIKLAKKFNGEIVSADSRQVYQGMDIITGKDLKKFSIFNFQFLIKRLQLGYYLIDGIRVWLYDVVQPDYQFNVADYTRCANTVIKDIWQQGKLPIVVGGTGFYIKALLGGVETMAIKPNEPLRKRLADWRVEKLANYLQKIDPQKWRSLNESDRQNPRRLVRAIEVAKTGISPRRSPLDTVRGEILFIGLKASYPYLYRRIDKRVKQRIKAGAEKEVKKLLKKYSFQKSILGATIGYRQWQDYFKSKITREEMIRQWQFSEHAYARRQMAWFKKNSKIKWFDISQNKWQDKVIYLVKKWCQG